MNRRTHATLAESIASRRLGTFLLELFAVVALLLVLIGIDGSMAFFVGQRPREIGVRLAVGAPAGKVWLMVTRKGISVATAKVVLGLVIAAELTHAIRTGKMIRCSSIRS